MVRKVVSFNEISKLFEDTMKSISDPSTWNRLLSEEQKNLINLANLVFEKVKTKCEVFLDICKGLKKGYDLGSPGIEDAFCFPSRFLKVPSISNLIAENRVILEEILENTFFLGIVSYLRMLNFPTRSDLESINLNDLFNKWGVDAVIANNLMKSFDDKSNGLFSIIIKSYYKAKVEPILKERFRFGFWNLGKCDSYFGNLFFAGSLLAVQFDLMTRK
jgi:hypothetical protein